jgi:hypothetical protein
MTMDVYGEWRDKDGNVAVLQSDPLSRAKYERKGWTYTGPAKQIPGLEPANPDGEREGVKDLDATEVVKQAADVVLRKISGTWTAAEAAAERAEIRSVMDEHGSFDWYKANLPESEKLEEGAMPPPYPLEGPPAGAAVSMTGGDGVPIDGASAPAPATPAPHTSTRSSKASTTEKA